MQIGVLCIYTESSQLMYFGPGVLWIYCYYEIEEVSNARAMAEKPKLKFEACRQITHLITQS